jgi:hypothetical protein
VVRIGVIAGLLTKRGDAHQRAAYHQSRCIIRGRHIAALRTPGPYSDTPYRSPPGHGGRAANPDHSRTETPVRRASILLQQGVHGTWFTVPIFSSVTGVVISDLGKVRHPVFPLVPGLAKSKPRLIDKFQGADCP